MAEAPSFLVISCLWAVPRRTKKAPSPVRNSGRSRIAFYPVPLFLRSDPPTIEKSASIRRFLGSEPVLVSRSDCFDRLLLPSDPGSVVRRDCTSGRDPFHLRSNRLRRLPFLLDITHPRTDPLQCRISFPLSPSSTPHRNPVSGAWRCEVDLCIGDRLSDQGKFPGSGARRPAGGRGCCGNDPFTVDPRNPSGSRRSLRNCGGRSLSAFSFSLNEQKSCTSLCSFSLF